MDWSSLSWTNVPSSRLFRHVDKKSQITPILINYILDRKIFKEQAFLGISCPKLLIVDRFRMFWNILRLFRNILSLSKCFRIF